MGFHPRPLGGMHPKTRGISRDPGGKCGISPCCKDAIREFALYRWDEKAGRDQPVRENDHAMDDIRYFAATWLDRDADAGFFVSSVTRHEEQEG